MRTNNNLKKMGIRELNQLIATHVPETTFQRIIPLSSLAHKKIAIDISNYIYKYKSSERLIEKMYQLFIMFRNHNIIPVLVFDGKNPIEKNKQLQTRRTQRKLATEQFKTADIKTLGHVAYNKIKQTMTYITHTDIQQVKQLADNCGIPYIQAIHEADAVCAYMVVHGYAWACLSEDTDMYALGCIRVLRNLKCANQTVVLCQTTDLLNHLGITRRELVEISVLSCSTDYQEHDPEPTKTNEINEPKGNLCDIYTKWHQYKKKRDEMGGNEETKEKDETKETLFSVIGQSLLSECEFQKICMLFELNENEMEDSISSVAYSLMPICKPKLRQLLEEDGFVII
jgi:hypothetical protein